MAPRRPAAPEGSMPPPSRPSSPPVMEEIEETPFFDSIDELQQHGINVQDILKLKSAAIHTVSGVVMTTRRNMLKIKGMSEAKVEKIKEAAQKIVGSSFGTGIEVQDRRKRVLVISTGSKSVDAILGGNAGATSRSPAVLPVLSIRWHHVPVYIRRSGVFHPTLWIPTRLTRG
ncbi:hypothetical protein BDN67DRAFT_473392 [Paxillus ammoniavirescens]|nr:hypothetical protein BDN67DRAFT_473392 [Paxillus ammoniavirescens]